jgi:hypothetical protein
MKTGDYTVHYFNRYGKRLKTLEYYAESIVEAKSQGEHFLKNTQETDAHHKAVSFAVDRRIFNSLDSES